MKKERNVNIELLRCVACYFVIMIHIWGSFRTYGGEFHFAVFAGGVFARCAVPVFFMIIGYVYHNEEGILYKYKRLIGRVLIPVLIMAFFSSVMLSNLIHYFIDATHEVTSVSHFFELILLGKPSDLYLCFHFWYIEELVKIYIFLPLLQFVLCWEKKADRIRRGYLILGGIVNFILPFLNQLLGKELLRMYSPVGVSVWYVLLGYELSGILKREKRRKQVGILGMLFYIGSCLIICVLEYFLEYCVTGDIDHGFSGNSSVFIAICTVGIFMFVNSIRIPEKLHEGIRKVGKATLGIYIVHVVVYNVIYQLHFDKFLEFMPPLIFCMLFSTLVFVISYIGIITMQRIIYLVSEKMCQRNKSGK